MLVRRCSDRKNVHLLTFLAKKPNVALTSKKIYKKSHIEKSETLSFGVMVSYAYHTHTARVAGSEVGGEEPRRLGVVTAWREVE